MKNRRIILFIAAALCALLCAVGLFACGDANVGPSSDINSGSGNGNNEDPAEHTEHSYVVSVIDPTCADRGYTLHKCACGDEYRDNYVDATGAHTPKAAVRENEVEATREHGGSYDEVVYCKDCNTEISRTPRTVERLQHTPKAAVRENEVEATCEHGGSYDEVVYCRDCNAEISRTPRAVEQLRHMPKAAIRENVVEATCEHGGSYDEVVYCKDCNAEISRTPRTVERLQHTPKAAVHENIVPPTYETEGSYDSVVRCEDCNRVISSEHVIVDKLMPTGTDIYSKTLAVDGDKLYGKLANGTEYFRFAGDITVADGASYYLCTDILGLNVIPTKIAPLVTGDNTFYLVVENGNADPMTYTVTLRVRPMYTVSFDSTGSSEEIPSQTVEEDSFAVQPTVPDLLLGYEFKGWSYDFTQPISADLEVTAFDVEEQMSNFTFESSLDTCVVTGIKDNTVAEINVPDYVTEIAEGAFNGCGSLTSVTLPFVGGSIKNTRDTYQYPLGYIFGTSSYAGSTATTQYYYGSSTDSIGHDTKYYIPTSLKNVIVTGGNILRGAFYNCSSLTSVVIHNSVTSIGQYAFRGCSSLADIEIPNSVMDIGQYAFDGCSSLASVEIPSSVTSIGQYAFCDCSSLKGIEIPNSVTIIGEYVFDGCGSLASVVIPSSVTSIGQYAFRSCSGLNGIEIPNSVASIGEYAFYGCSGLIGIEIPNSVTSIGRNAFYGCSSLTCIELPYSVTRIESYTFGRCSSLTGIEIPNSVTSIGSSAFYGCSSFTSIEIPNSVTSMGGSIFSGCGKMKSITLPFISGTLGSIFGIENYSGATGVKQYFANNRYITYYIPTTLNSVTILGGETIPYGAFYGCSNLTRIDIPSSVISISKHAFYGCSNLTSIEIPNSVTSIEDNAFLNCDRLNKVNYTGSIEGWCNIEFKLSYSNPLSYAHELYINDELITEVVIPKSFKEIKAYTFCGCNSLTIIEIPNSVTNIGDWAFAYCSSLTSIDIPNSVTNIGQSAFYGCSGLTSIELPNSVTSIDGHAFYGCRSLTSIEIPNGVTSIVGYTFYGCRNLTSIKIPNSVTSIGWYAFYGCENLKRVYYYGNKTDWDSIEWQNVEIDSNNSCIIHATKYYYSETEPPLNGDGTDYDGNYWHYDGEGKIVVWEKDI